METSASTTLCTVCSVHYRLLDDELQGQMALADQQAADKQAGKDAAKTARHQTESEAFVGRLPPIQWPLRRRQGMGQGRARRRSARVWGPLQCGKALNKEYAMAKADDDSKGMCKGALQVPLV